MPIHTEVITSRQLTLHTVQGELIFNEVMATFKTYNALQPTTNVLWDFREAVLTSLTADHIRSLIHFSTQYDALRPDGRSALLISSRPGAYSMARIAEILNDVEKSTIRMGIFYDYAEALHWLEADR